MKTNQFNQIVNIINKDDPMGLLKLGAPNDEYYPEVSLIDRYVKPEDSVSDIRDLVYSVFVNQFCIDEDPKQTVGVVEDYQIIAEEIKKILAP